MKRKFVHLFLSVILLASLVSCVGLQEKWGALTPDQKAQVIIGDIQGQLTNAFNTGKAYIATKPEYQEKWKTQIVPAFDIANKALASVIVLGKTKPLTPEFVYAQVQPQVTNVVNLLILIGAIK